MQEPLRLGILFAAAFALSLAGTYAWRRIALLRGHTANPDPLHPHPTPLSGGIAIIVAALIAQAAVGFTRSALVVWAGSLAFAALGLWDDIRAFSPRIKLLLQVVIAVALMGVGVSAAFTPHWLAAIFSVFWILAVVNAFNLIDNMDGVAAGIVTIAALVTAIVATVMQAPNLAVNAIVLAGSAFGFLPLNFPPAKVFMGDCGSMFLGSFLALNTILLSWSLLPHVGHAGWVLVVLALLLYTPLLNLAFVTVLRKLEGVPIAAGTADHLNYRLLAMGISPRRVTYSFALIAVVGGGFAIGLLYLRPAVLPALLAIIVVGTLYLALYLSGADVSELRRGFARKKTGDGTAVQFPVGVLVYFVDLTFIPLAYYAAFLIRFDASLTQVQIHNFTITLPFLMIFRFAALRLFGLYSFHWKYAGMHELIKLMGAIGGSAVLLFGAASLANIYSFSRGVILIDAALAVILLGFSRFGLQALEHLVVSARPTEDSASVLVIGAGNAGATFMRECRSNRSLGLRVVAFLDDDGSKLGMKIYGAPVIGAIGNLREAMDTCKAEVAVIAIPSLSAERMAELEGLCVQAGVPYKVFNISLRDGWPHDHVRLAIAARRGSV